MNAQPVDVNMGLPWVAGSLFAPPGLGAFRVAMLLRQCLNVMLSELKQSERCSCSFYALASERFDSELFDLKIVLASRSRSRSLLPQNQLRLS